MPWRKFEQNMLTVLPLSAQTSTEHCLESQLQRRPEQWSYWFIYCILLLPHSLNIDMRFISQPFTFTDITDCFCNSCVFNVNLRVNENLVYSHAVTAAFCPCASDVCTQKTLYQKFKPIWFKTCDKHDNQNQNRFFLEGLSCNGAALFWKRGRDQLFI